VELKSQAHFDNARRKAFWRQVVSRLTGRSNDLLPFDEVQRRLPLQGQRFRGLQTVPLDRIVGSVGRYRDFDRAFLPRRDHTRSRWVSIDRAHQRQITLPPVDLYQIGEVYFVKDGNHRVSVARERGQDFIDALVTEIDIPVLLTSGTNLDDLIAQQEYAAFVAQTRITSLRPDARIELSLPGQYEKLLRHIADHRWYLGEQRDSAIPVEEAVASWYDTVYLPLVEIIRAAGILREFPKRTEADLYLWIIEHHWYLQETDRAVPLEEAARRFADAYSERPSRRLARALKRANPMKAVARRGQGGPTGGAQPIGGDVALSPTGCILVALSISSLTEAKLEVAREHARAFDADVLLLHVLSPTEFDPEEVTSAEATARAALDAAIDQLQSAGVRAQALVRTGSVAPTIVAEARDHQARLIILGSSLRSRLPRMLLGSIEDAVTFRAMCPVLLVRPPDDIVSGPSVLSLAPSDPLLSQHLGLRTVDLARVVGSATRAYDIGPDFRSRLPTTEDEQRFQGILAALSRGEDLPPVELYKLGFGYYVRDGHHRVAAARQLGRTEISAVVTELLPGSDDVAQRTRAARESFDEATGLTRIGAARAESYAWLRSAIESHQTTRGLADLREAAQSWHAEVFRPLRRRVRQMELARRFPGERPADVIARLVAWRAAEIERTGAAPGWEESLERFGATLGHKV
jgi:nucleotide-binding universal stress UspA family protein/uncharacterized ParB-like nuclease family protein